MESWRRHPQQEKASKDVGELRFSFAVEISPPLTAAMPSSNLFAFFFQSQSRTYRPPPRAKYVASREPGWVACISTAARLRHTSNFRLEIQAARKIEASIQARNSSKCQCLADGKWAIGSSAVLGDVAGSLSIFSPRLTLLTR